MKVIVRGRMGNKAGKPKNRRKENSDISQTILFGSLAAVTTFETLFFWPAFGNAYTVPKAVIVLIGGAILLPQVCRRVLQRPISNSYLLLIALFGLQILVMTGATIFSLSPAVSFWGGDWRRMGWITQFAMMCIALAVPIGCDSRQLKRFLRVITILGALSAVYGLLQWIGWDPFIPAFMREQIIAQFGGRYRAPGTIGQSIYFANYLLYPFFSALALTCVETERLWRVVSVAAIAIVGAALVFAASARASMLGGIAGLIAFAVCLLLPRLRQMALPTARQWAMTLLVFGAAIVLSLYAGHRFSSLGTDTETTGRIILWRDVTNRMLPHVWGTGTGPGMFRAAYARYRSPDYGLFGPNVHWETPHNFFLDRLLEQGIGGLITVVLMVIAFAFNIYSSVRHAPDRKTAACYTAIGAGLAAALASNLFNGEVIPTTYYFYLWIALSFATLDAVQVNRPAASMSKAVARGWVHEAVIVGGIAVAVLLAWHAQRNWAAETSFRQAEVAAGSGDFRGLLASTEDAIENMSTYDVNSANLIVDFVRQNGKLLDTQSQQRLTRKGIETALPAIRQSDEPMLALFALVSLGEMTSDTRTATWKEELRAADPWWFQTRQLSALSLARQGNIDAAAKEITIAHELAPYDQTSTNLFRQIVALRRERDRRTNY